MTGRFTAAAAVSGRKAAGRLGRFAVVLAIASSTVACSESPDRPPATYVADDSAEWRAGVNGQPLAPGESLLFDFGRAVTVTWNMRGVEYPLQLVALSDDGRELGSWGMPVGMPDLRPDVRARFWIELRE